MLFIYYPKCSTCQKAKKFLDENNINYDERHIVEDNPTKDEIKSFLEKGIDLKKLFNTSGLKYRQLNLKDKLKTMSDEEKIDLLSTDGMLVKRPILVAEDFVISGFKEEDYKNKLNILNV